MGAAFHGFIVERVGEHELEPAKSGSIQGLALIENNLCAEGPISNGER
jgi:hypothetical protein